jgi:hypothetical protein
VEEGNMLLLVMVVIVGSFSGSGISGGNISKGKAIPVQAWTGR